MGASLLPDLATQILIPVCGVIGIAFALFQWVLVSSVKMSAGGGRDAASKNGNTDYLIEEEEGVNDHSVVAKCAEIQNAISEGSTSFLFTMYKYVGIFMVAFAVLIFVFLGSVDGFTLVVASISSFGINHEFTAMLYPLIISAVGILVCLITTLFATDFFEIKAVKEIEPALKKQLVISTVLMTVGIAVVSWVALPASFTIFNFGTQKDVTNWQLFLCVAVGLWAGLIIGFVTEYYTSNAYSPVQDVADSCRTGAATNVIFGLALGYKSVIIPIFAIAISIFVSFSFAAMYGIAVAALGMLSTIATAALVSLALFGAFVSRASITTVDVLTPKVFIGLIVGAMLPYWFSAMTMKSVGSAALKMVEEVRRQFNTIPGLMEGTAKPDYATCVKISTDASIKEMIPPGALVMLTPLIVGIFFGVETLSGVLAGSLVSGVQIAISASNTGGAWDNAKKYIEAGASDHARSLGPKGSDPHKAAVIGDTIGDPLKDTSGPSLNILIKLMAVESLVFAPFFATHGGLLFKI
ncbi:unnamed protein product [Linum tenue]|uniref:H(+)-exporting diphosphatase n=1 Tax=Linum tenue TaxID=586396 RepID=A0AAV0HUR1_9ROSI|nr:unnamed protein product [Linum tenue]